MLDSIELKINKKRALLNKAIEDEKSYGEIYRISVELDQLILEYYKIKEKKEFQDLLKEYNDKNKINEKKIAKYKKNRKKISKNDKIEIPIKERIINFIKNRNEHREFFNSIISKIIIWIVGVILIPNIIADIMQNIFINNIELYNLAFLISSVIFNLNLLLVTMKMISLRHKCCISIISVFIYSIRYFFILKPLKVVFIIIIPFTITNLWMIHIYQYMIFKLYKSLPISAVISASFKIISMYCFSSIIKIFVNDIYTINIIDNILIYRQVIPILISIFMLSNLYALYIRKCNIKIEKYNITFKDLFIKENKDKIAKMINRRKKIRTLVDY